MTPRGARVPSEAAATVAASLPLPDPEAAWGDGWDGPSFERAGTVTWRVRLYSRLIRRPTRRRQFLADQVRKHLLDGGPAGRYGCSESLSRGMACDGSQPRT